MLKTHGITANTAGDMLLSAGVIYSNLAYDSEASKWTGDVIGATSGGVKFSYEPKYTEIDIDGALVMVKGVSKQKVGEAATLEGSFTEYNADLLQKTMHIVVDETSQSPDDEFTKYITKKRLEATDYEANVAYVGTKTDGTQIIIILPNAVCTESFELEAKNGEQNTYKFKFECTANLTANDLDTLPIEIYLPASGV